MAQYATATDLANLGLPAAALEGISPAIQDEHLRKASGRVDSYLRGRYSLPLAAPYPDEIIEATVILAAYSLLVFRGFNPDEYDSNFVRRYQDMVGNTSVGGSRGWLDRVASGRANLATSADATSGTQEGAPTFDTAEGSTADERGWATDAHNAPTTRYI